MTRTCVLCLTLLSGLPVAAQHAGALTDESKVPQYTLPDPFLMHSGERVRDAEAWARRRRPEILHLFETYMYGRNPVKAPALAYEVFSSAPALEGKAIRRQVSIYFSGTKSGPKMDLLLYLPANAGKPAPVFLGLNFSGNHAVHADPGIKLGDVWIRDPKSKTYVKRAATAESRGAGAASWQVEKIIARGYGLATVYVGDVEPDFDGGIRYGFRTLYYKDGEAPAPDEWGTIGAWAWGLSRALDYLETDKGVDAKRVAVIGHSRLGKTSLWAGAQDTRFAMVIGVQSGEGGAAISRRKFGERVKDLNRSFPYWFCGNYKSYDDREEELPVDSHMLIALIAPRPVYVSSAEEDSWADPKGEFLSLVNAAPVYQLLGRRGLGTEQMPPLHQPVMGVEGYHIRAGKHQVTAYDWDQYLTFADKNFRAER